MIFHLAGRAKKIFVFLTEKNPENKQKKPNKNKQTKHTNNPWRETKDHFVLFSYLLTCLKLLKDICKKWKFHFCLKIWSRNNVTLPVLKAWNWFCLLWFSVQRVLVLQHLSPWADITYCPQGPVWPSWGCVWRLLLPPPMSSALPCHHRPDRSWWKNKRKKKRRRVVMWFYDGIYWVDRNMARISNSTSKSIYVCVEYKVCEIGVLEAVVFIWFK